MIHLSPELHDAIQNDLPVVALESTIITHGMPYPQNVETALSVEQAVKDAGAVPATIAIIDGKLKAGLTESDVEYLGKKGQDVIKVSRRDMPVICATRQDGATTVAATMIIAEMAGIKIFATGGIGGVHRGAAQTMDISADLQELARTNVAVISSGAKAILDLPLTLEYLETMGVPVIGYQTEEFPAFYTRESGLNVGYRIDTPEGIASVLLQKWELELNGGVLIANPIPKAYAMPQDIIEDKVQTAIAEAAALSISGKDLTPFLLAKIEELTSGSSLKSNIELVLNNARLAAHISKAYMELGGE